MRSFRGRLHSLEGINIARIMCFSVLFVVCCLCVCMCVSEVCTSNSCKSVNTHLLPTSLPPTPIPTTNSQVCISWFQRRKRTQWPPCACSSLNYPTPSYTPGKDMLTLSSRMPPPAFFISPHRIPCPALTMLWDKWCSHKWIWRTLCRSGVCIP